MPELPEEMYCSQQICIPPTYPYLLRQFAKAAIRTQPTDLLRWSTAYFRCLSLNLRPPIKPRLEYPIPKSYFGLTPGWLKALIYQLQNNLTISFPILWDRWIGACLQHENLIQILCLGGFADNKAIPWLRFVALCAAHLTENLTQSMILICEVLTEEPEGGSAMIPLEIFLDLYIFLSKIDASEPQVLKNLYFTDAELGIFKDAPVAEVKEIESEISVVSAEETIEIEEEEERDLSEFLLADKLSTVISCPDVTTDEFHPEEEIEFLEDELVVEYSAKREGSGGFELGAEEVTSTAEQEQPTEQTGEAEQEQPAEQAEQTDKEEPAPAENAEQTQELEPELEEGAKSALSLEEPDKKTDILSDEAPEPPKEVPIDEQNVQQETQDEQQKEGTETDAEVKPSPEPTENIVPETVDEIIEEPVATDLDVSKLSTFEEIPGEVDEDQDIVELKILLEEQEQKKDEKEEEVAEKPEEEVEEEEVPPEDLGEDVYVEAVIGIGPIVPPHLMNVVVQYMKEVSIDQHGMVMPRNIRHYSCPPLEVLQ